MEDGMRPPACRGLRPGGKWELTMQRAESIELEMSSDFSRKIGNTKILIYTNQEMIWERLLAARVANLS